MQLATGKRGESGQGQWLAHQDEYARPRSEGGRRGARDGKGAQQTEKVR